MKKYKNITVLFFLGIFSLLLLHQVIPHLHHQHQGTHEHNVSHNHHAHHHHKPEKKDSKKGFLDWFLEIHLHSNIQTDVLTLEQTSFKKSLYNKKEVTSDTNKNYIRIHFVDTGLTNNWYH